ncbi:hypothetical protein BU15DRAFT_46251 [Melanogaster broomeanus]|nr:hypothetical protein BU15DRAFT_46251 [Melanogaster broomeanus]
MSSVRKELTQHIHLLNFVRRSQLHNTSSLRRATSSLRHGSKSFRCSHSSASQSHEANTGILRRSNIRMSTLFTALIILGAGTTAVGLYEFYSMFTLWPKELRADLRAGIKAKNQDNPSLSERYLTRAYQTALSLSPSALGPDPYLKLSGIAAVLTEVAPERRAKEALQSVWDIGGATESPTSSGDEHEAAPADNNQSWGTYTLTNEERLRRVAVAYKLAELSTEQSEEEGKWLVWAVQEVLRLVGRRRARAVLDGPNAVSQTIMLAELELPSWMRKVDLGAPLEALGTFYAKQGKRRVSPYAMPLYLQAISLLLPPKMENVSIEDRCQAAHLMNNLSELIMRRPPSPEIRHQAEAWARQAYGVIERTQDMPLPRRWWFSHGDEDNREVCESGIWCCLV